MDLVGTKGGDGAVDATGGVDEPLCRKRCDVSSSVRRSCRGPAIMTVLLFLMSVMLSGGLQSWPEMQGLSELMVVYSYVWVPLLWPGVQIIVADNVPGQYFNPNPSPVLGDFDGKRDGEATCDLEGGPGWLPDLQQWQNFDGL